MDDLGYLATEEANKIVQKRCTFSSILVHGNALRHCDTFIVESHGDDLIQELTLLVKESFDTFALSVICSYTKELLRRLIQTTAATTPSLSRLVASLFTHHTSSPDCQAVVNHTISCIASVFPASVKDHRSVLIEWTKKGLYSGHVGLVKESALLLTVLHSRKQDDATALIDSSLQILQYCILSLKGEEIDEEKMDTSILLPSLPFGGHERMLALIRTVKGLTRLISTCHYLHSSHTFTIPLHEFLAIVWLALDSRIMVSSLNIFLQQTSWQLLLVLIRSCKTHLLPYSEVLEAGFVRTLENNPPPLIISLVCECIVEWVRIRGFEGMFLEMVISLLCLHSHKSLQRIVQEKKKWRICNEGSDHSLLFFCMNTIKMCLQNLYCELPPTLTKGIHTLVTRISSDMSPELLNLANQLKLYTNTHQIHIDKEVIEEGESMEGSVILSNIQSNKISPSSIEHITISKPKPIVESVTTPPSNTTFTSGDTSTPTNSTDTPTASPVTMTIHTTPTTSPVTMTINTTSVPSLVAPPTKILKLTNEEEEVEVVEVDDDSAEDMLMELFSD